MKKTLVMAAVAASFTSVAHAQSSVTLYGLLDAGVTYTSNVNGGKQFAVTSGNIDQSLFGLRGVEDLGGGLKAIFTLESGFNVGNGKYANDGSMFNRQSYVGLSSQYGTVTLGRQFDAVQDYLAPLTATGSWGGTYFAHPFNNDNLSTNNGSPANNSVKFASANYAGFTFGGTYGFSNQSNFANNREYSFGAAYEFQGLRIGAGYAQQNNPGSTPNGATDSPSFTALNGAFGNFRQREFGVAANYAYGPLIGGIAWTQSRADNFADAGISERLNNYEVNVKYNMTPALSFGLAYTYTNGYSYGVNSDGGKVNYNQFGLLSNYALSKRTDLYTEVVYQHSSGDNAAIYSGGMNLPSTSADQTTATVGLRHRF
jgi:predicted porin